MSFGLTDGNAKSVRRIAEIMKISREWVRKKRVSALNELRRHPRVAQLAE